MRELVNPETLATQVRMLMQTGDPVVLLEGDTDARVFRGLLLRQCRRVSCLNRDFALQVWDLLDDKKGEGIIIIVDRDYNDFLNSVAVEEGLFFYDYNDLEAMLFFSGALERFLGEYGSQSKLGSGDPRVDIVAEAVKLGVLRYFSLKCGYHLKFSGMTYKFTSRHDFEVDFPKQVEHLLARSKSSSIDCDALCELVCSYREELADESTICHGDDLMRLLSRALSRRIGNTNDFDSNKRFKELERPLRLAFGRAEFETTSLFNDILTFEANRPNGFNYLDD